MEIAVLFFLTSGLFLGWSLGANDAANVFGTAVGTRMVSFTTAALVCSVGIVLGAVFSGAGAADTLGRLGSINALAGSFVVASAAALTVYWMTKASLPVSTSQAIVGAIVGWNWFSGSVTDISALIKIVGTWVVCPLLAGFIAVPLFMLVSMVVRRAGIHLLRLDAYTRVGLIAAGAFGSYSLGANNIANVMGVFVPVSPFTDIDVGGLFTFFSVQQLFLIGAIAIGVGVFTYSKKVMLTVGAGLLPLSPVAAWVVVVSHSIVLFLFASEGLEHLLASNGLPTIPLVPVSSSQAVVGAVIGIGLLGGGKNIRWRVLGNISAGWVATPVVAACLCFIFLFIVQNVFNQPVYHAVHYELSPVAAAHLREQGIAPAGLEDIGSKEFESAAALRKAVQKVANLTTAEEKALLEATRVSPIYFVPYKVASLEPQGLSESQYAAVQALSGRSFRHRWELAVALATASDDWRFRERTTANKRYNKKIERQLGSLFTTFARSN